MWVMLDSMKQMLSVYRSHTFHLQFFRPSSSRWIRVYEENGLEVISIDVALPSSPVTYPNSSLDKTLSFTTNYLFVGGRKYYVLLEPGEFKFTNYLDLSQ